MQRSRIVQTLNVPQRVRLGPSLAAALLDELFEHPAGSVLLSQTCRPLDFRQAGFVFPQPARIHKFSLTQAMLAEKKMTGTHRGLRRVAMRDMRDWRDGRDEVEIKSVHAAPFSPISRFTRHDLWRQRTFSVSC
jgi:hypothetical protein